MSDQCSSVSPDRLSKFSASSAHSSKHSKMGSLDGSMGRNTAKDNNNNPNMTITRLYESSSSSLGDDSIEDIDNDDGHERESTYNFLVARPTQLIDMEDSGEEENGEDFEVLKMKDVKFSSCPNLLLALECCQVDYEEKENFERNTVIQDFILLKTISSGAYGKVVLARKKKTNDIFAIKVLDKEVMIQKNVKDLVLNEKEILT